MRRLILAATLLVGLTACATSQEGQTGLGASVDRQLMGLSQTDGAQLEAAVEEAEAHPLGSAENPVRTAQPSGQRAYLSRLRCADGSTPAYQRIGSFGFGPYGNIVDGYEVRCPDADPKTVVMDMYHPGHVEERAVAGFTITPS